MSNFPSFHSLLYILRLYKDFKVYNYFRRNTYLLQLYFWADTHIDLWLLRIYQIPNILIVAVRIIEFLYKYVVLDISAFLTLYLYKYISLFFFLFLQVSINVVEIQNQYVRYYADNLIYLEM